jgi:hypothetical protein
MPISAPVFNCQNLILLQDFNLLRLATPTWLQDAGFFLFGERARAYLYPPKEIHTERLPGLPGITRLEQRADFLP